MSRLLGHLESSLTRKFRYDKVIYFSDFEKL